MRSSFEMRLVFTEAEANYMAMEAYKASIPSVIDWMKRQLLGTPATVQPPIERPAETAPAVNGEAALPATLAPPASEPTASETAPPDSEAAPERERKPQRRTQDLPDGLVPRGFDAIMAVAESIIAARKEIAASTGSVVGGKYNRTMSKWYNEHGMEDYPVFLRVQLATIGQNAAEIRAWYEKNPNSLPDDVYPLTLFNRFQAATPETTLVVRGRRIQRVPVSEALGGKPTGATIVGAENLENGEPEFDNFAVVDLDSLPPKFARTLRRFTTQIINQGGASDTMPQADIAAAVRKIKPATEKGDNPSTAQDLCRLGVLAGSSGDYRLRPEYIRRFDDVQRWAGT